MELRATYDGQANAAYIYLVPIGQGEVKRTYCCDDPEAQGNVNLDFDASGHLVGIEILNASQILPRAVLKQASIIG